MEASLQAGDRLEHTQPERTRLARTRLEEGLRGASLLVLCIAALVCVIHTIHWPMMWDSTVLHYGSFLISQGKIPYRDVIEPDLPGTYMLESAAMHVFGGGDLGWHLYDLFLLAVLTTACIVIAKPRDWIAGLFAGICFAQFHLRYGPRNAGQREEVIAVCLIVALAFLFRANRTAKPWLMLPFGFFVGAASSIKPTACLLGLLSLWMLIHSLRKRRIEVPRYVGLALLGFFIAASFTVVFLWRFHAFRDFLLDERLLIPYYEKIGISPLRSLLLSVPRQIWAVLLFGLLLTVLRRRLTWPGSWERAVLLLAFGCGLLSYLLQHKVFEHHTYLAAASVFLFFAVEVFGALQGSPSVRGAGAAILSLCLVLTAQQTYSLYRTPAGDPITPVMMADLTRLGGSSLSGKVQCFDIVLACSSSLYRLKLVENVAFTNDFMVLTPPGATPIPYFRQRLWDDLQRHPPQVIIVTDEQLLALPGYGKIDRWPEFAAYLRSGYTLETTRTFPENSYRVYVRKPLS